ncbi:PorT family protein [Flavobacterium sp. CYK-55]|uniref:porin family protein n=1 Tax=Flavobacterium sp. CYK-55 TaxID=2835529 RepID=UPI001BCB9D1B|nr:porin family protein [Flavobacterium sp. CYK-55]MBS7785929.1 PorT family protein [Flavobacterium sp. CYK-55]
MKKITLCALLCFSLFVHAQDKTVRKTRFGLKAGLNISSLRVSGVRLKGDLSYKAGFHIGGMMQVSLSKDFLMQPELMFSNQGYNYEERTGAAKYSKVGNINYLALPVMFVYYPIKNLSLEAGPQLSFLLSHKAKVDVTGVDKFDPTNPYIDEGTIDLKNESRTVEFGANLGLAYKINQQFFCSARYNLGITAANIKDKGSDEIDRNSVFQFSIGYLF